MPQDISPDLIQPYDPSAQRTVSPVDWFGPHQEYPARTSTAVSPLVCGEDAFAAVARVLRSARRSINMCFWGLDPAMLLERGTAELWDHDAILGEILLERAAAGVQVRVVVWNTYYQALGSGSNGAEDPTAGSGGENSANLAWFRDICKDRENIEVKMTDSLGVRTKFPSFHQKSIITDIETPVQARAFVMGHNMLVPYWSAPELRRIDPRRQFYLQIVGDNTLAVRREKSVREVLEQRLSQSSKSDFDLSQIANLRAQHDQARTEVDAFHGRTFAYEAKTAPHLTPYFDVSSLIWGKAIVDVYANFARVWKLNDGVISPDPASLKADEFVYPPHWHAPVQVAATFPRATPPARGIEQLYRQAMRNANRYILIVNQYFRNWPLTDEMIEWWASSRNVPTEKRVPMMVVTNDWNGKAVQEGHDGQTLEKFANAGIPISMGKMLTQEAGPHTTIYVHAKLLIVDDVFYTIGSANYNLRSLGTDPELNVGVVQSSEALALRRKVMNILVGDPMNELGSGDPMAAFANWETYLERNTAAATTTGSLPHGRVVRYDAISRSDGWFGRWQNGIVMNRTTQNGQG